MPLGAQQQLGAAQRARGDNHDGRGDGLGGQLGAVVPAVGGSQISVKDLIAAVV